MKLIDYFNQFEPNKYIGVEDASDKANFLVTVALLSFFSTLVALKQYVMKPISCYLSTDVGGENLEEYVENYCWVQGTIPLLIGMNFRKSENNTESNDYHYASKKLENIPQSEQDWQAADEYKILYYQWIPFMLGLQAIMFYIPRIVWQIIYNHYTGTDLQHLISLGRSNLTCDDENQRQKSIKFIAKTIATITYKRYKNKHRKIRDWFNFFAIQNPLGKHIFGVYIFIKFLYLINAVGQLFLMESFLGFKHQGLFGNLIIHAIANGEDWETTLVFPRVSFCYIPIRHISGPNFVTAQCALPVNMLNERIYVFLWFWFFCVATATIISMPIWFIQIMYEKTRTNFVTKYLTMNELVTGHSSYKNENINDFTKKFLQRDSIFILRMMALNTGDIICIDIIGELWWLYIEWKGLRDKRKFAKCKEMERKRNTRKASMIGPHPNTVKLLKNLRKGDSSSEEFSYCSYAEIASLEEIENTSPISFEKRIQGAYLRELSVDNSSINLGNMI